MDAAEAETSDAGVVDTVRDGGAGTTKKVYVSV